MNELLGPLCCRQATGAIGLHKAVQPPGALQEQVHQCCVFAGLHCSRGQL